MADASSEFVSPLEQGLTAAQVRALRHLAGEALEMPLGMPTEKTFALLRQAVLSYDERIQGQRMTVTLRPK
jgi:hypothetical protein